MKKTIAMLLVCAMMLSLCACSTVDHEKKEAIGYVIIHHYDGDEHAPIYNYYTTNGVITVYTTDGRRIAGTDLVVIVENN